MFKKISLISMTIVIFFVCSILVNAQDKIDITIDGNKIAFDEMSGFPFADDNNRTQVPLRKTLETFGAEVIWMGEENMVVVTKGDVTLQIPMEESWLFINGEKIQNDTKPFAINGRTYLPIRIVMESFGCKVTWDTITRTVQIISQSDMDKELIRQANQESIDKILVKADKRRQAILSSETTITYTGVAYYVSTKGNDNNNGLSEDTPWASVEMVNNASLKPGDAVFFERGGLWRGSPLYTQEGVTYSAYGTGNKPKLYISPENGAAPQKWDLLEGTNNIWVYHKDMQDCGNIVFNDGEYNGIKKLPYYNGNKFVLRFDHDTDFDLLKELDTDLDFFTPADSNLPKESELPFYQFDNGYTEGKVYLRCDKGNPGDVFESIEFLIPIEAVFLTKECIIDNLCFKYGGACGTGGTTEGTTVQNCEFAWFGGYVLSYDPNDTYEGGTIPAGDGIKLNGSNSVCLNNYVHDIFEYGVTVEAGYRDDFEVKHQENLSFKGNLIERCGGGSILIFNWEEEANPDHMFINVNVEDNYALYNGYCTWDRWEYMSTALCFFDYPNANDGIYIRDNVFYLSKNGPLIYSKIPEKYSPVFSGNTYIQGSQDKFLVWRTTDDNGYNISDENINRIVQDELGDNDGIVIESFNDYEQK